ncbi:MAG: GntR family transcriptional regulator [Alphaproteobacteria bacterium]
MADLDLQTRSGSDIEKAYWRLRQEILSSRLAPGEKLRIQHLTATFGYGASAVREALSRLLSDGLVESVSQRGFWVSQISCQDLQDITEARKLIEVEALRQAITHGDMAWEKRVVAASYALERLEVSLTRKSDDAVITWENANRDFHLELISACPTRRLLQFTAQLYDQSLRYRYRTTQRRTFPRSGLSNDHTKIVQATLKRDADLACQLLENHISKIAKIAETAIFGEPAQKERKLASR